MPLLNSTKIASYNIRKQKQFFSKETFDGYNSRRSFQGGVSINMGGCLPLPRGVLYKTLGEFQASRETEVQIEQVELLSKIDQCVMSG